MSELKTSGVSPFHDPFYPEQNSHYYQRGHRDACDVLCDVVPYSETTNAGFCFHYCQVWLRLGIVWPDVEMLVCRLRRVIKGTEWRLSLSLSIDLYALGISFLTLINFTPLCCRGFVKSSEVLHKMLLAWPFTNTCWVNDKGPGQPVSWTSGIMPALSDLRENTDFFFFLVSTCYFITFFFI